MLTEATKTLTVIAANGGVGKRSDADNDLSLLFGDWLDLTQSDARERLINCATETFLELWLTGDLAYLTVPCAETWSISRSNLY